MDDRSSVERAIRAKIADNLYILFDSEADLLLFTANMGGFDQFKPVFEQLTRKRARPRDYWHYKTPESQIACGAMCQRTLLSDGTTLEQAIRNKVIKRGTP